MSEDIKKGLLGIVVDETEVSKVMPFCKPISLHIGITINRNNKKVSTKIKSQNKKVLAVGCNHKKYSTKSVKNRYKTPVISSAEIVWISAVRNPALKASLLLEFCAKK